MKINRLSSRWAPFWKDKHRRPRHRLIRRLEALETRRLLAVFSVSTTADSGAGSFHRRSSTPTRRSSRFDSLRSGGRGPWSIQPQTQLPEITGAVAIDGSTQPGFAGQPIVELDGSVPGGTSADGFYLGVSGCTVRGLVINRFKGNGIWDGGSGSQLIAGCSFGTDLTGKVALGNGTGIALAGSHNTIGGVGSSDRNLLSGNSTWGLYAAGDSKKLIEGSPLGPTSPERSRWAMPGNGAYLGGIKNTMGAATGAGNLISANGGSGIAIRAFAGRDTSFRGT